MDGRGEYPPRLLVILEDDAVTFLDAFAKLRKATVCFVVSVRLYTWNNSAPSRRILIKFYISGFFEDMYRTFKFH